MVVEVEDTLVERYQRDGAVLAEGVFDDAWVEKVRHGIAQNLALPSEYSERLTTPQNAGVTRLANLNNETAEYIVE